MKLFTKFCLHFLFINFIKNTPCICSKLATSLYMSLSTLVLSYKPLAMYAGLTLLHGIHISYWQPHSNAPLFFSVTKVCSLPATQQVHNISSRRISSMTLSMTQGTSIFSVADVLMSSSSGSCGRLR